jgi:hypothetical protein
MKGLIMTDEKPTRPSWRIDNFPPHVRNAAKSAAALAGMSLAKWLEELIIRETSKGKGN